MIPAKAVLIHLLNSKMKYVQSILPTQEDCYLLADSLLPMSQLLCLASMNEDCFLCFALKKALEELDLKVQFDCSKSS